MGMNVSAQVYRPAHTFPVSVKGVVVQNGKVLLLENERGEWELPGGKLELGEDPLDCVVREVSEETGWHITPGPLLDCWQYHIRQDTDVVIVTYGCHVLSSGPPVVSNEHKRVGLFGREQVSDLTMPDGYKSSITEWFARLDSGLDLKPLGGSDGRPMRAMRSARLTVGSPARMSWVPDTRQDKCSCGRSDLGPERRYSTART